MANDAPRTAPKTAERLAIEQARAMLALAAANMGEFEWDVERDLLVVSARMAKVTGVPAGMAPAKGGEYALSFVHPDDVDALRQAIGDSLIDKARYDVSYRMIRPDDGRVLWMESSALIVRGPDGPLRKLIGVVRDVSAHKADEAEREALAAELNHRVKNVLAVIQSLAAQTARKTVSLDQFLKTFAGRLEAMAAAHTLLSATRWRGADIADIAAAELGALAYGRARWSGPETMLNPGATNALTLALHELATNAVKFGALSNEDGRIDVTWRHTDDGGFELVWTERNGPPVSPPTRTGFGTTLFEKVTGRELGGLATLYFRSEGVRATVRAAASAVATHPALAPPVIAPVVEESDESAGGESVGELLHSEISGLRVIIVEDAVLLALELEAGLVEAGAEVVGLAANLDEAEQLLDLSFDAAVLDVDLNGRSVNPIARALTQRGIPFIFATGYDGSALAPDGYRAPVVRKPYNVHQIAAALVRAIANP